MKTMLKKLWLEEDGGETVEYALVIGLIVVGIALILPQIRTQVAALFQTILDTLNA